MTDLDKQHDEIFRKAQAAQNNNTEHRDEGIHATAHAPQQIVVNLDKNIGKHFLLIVWGSALVSAIAIIALFVLWDAHRITRQHVKILEYDLMDLRSKTGHAHENTE